MAVEGDGGAVDEGGRDGVRVTGSLEGGRGEGQKDMGIL